MREGWHDDYLVLLSDQESSDASRGYEIQKFLPGYQIAGLRGWDDFIVRDASGGVFTVPTVPMDPQYLAAWTPPPDSALLEPDSRFTGKIKWYTKPIVFVVIQAIRATRSGSRTSYTWSSSLGGMCCIETWGWARVTPNNRFKRSRVASSVSQGGSR
jgi:hypothetical protein